MKIVLLGAPGSGKGTQATHISKKYNLTHISTGDIFRENIKAGTPLGIKVKAIIDKGELCPDELTVELVKDRLSKPDCENGYLLDGFPRNLAQAESLDAFASPDVVINLIVPLDKLETRITGRRSCSKCNSLYHIKRIGDSMVCPQCGGQLIIRKDDTPETVKQRLDVYKKQTAPLIEYYSNQNKIRDIDGDVPVEQVFNEIEKVLD